MISTDYLSVHGRGHAQNYGWLPDQYAAPTMRLGTQGQARNLEAIEMWIE
ncbi:hypothetical protein ACFV9D_27620 [Streptomyces sp. NPDC059875]